MLKFYIKTPDEINSETDYLIELSGHNYVNNVDLGRISKISSVEKQIQETNTPKDQEDFDFLRKLIDEKPITKPKTEPIVTYLVTFENGYLQRYNEKQILMIGVKE